MTATKKLSPKQERKEVRKLGLRIVVIGFRKIAKKLHPDAGGSQFMARRNRAREILEASA